MKAKENLQELIGLIYELNYTDPNHNWFMDFAGHVDSVSVHYASKKGEPCKCCGTGVDRKTVWITSLTGFKNLAPLIKKVRKFLI